MHTGNTSRLPGSDMPTKPTMDEHGNRTARAGCDRCVCGNKYWENDVCIDCNAAHDPNNPSPGSTGTQWSITEDAEPDCPDCPECEHGDSKLVLAATMARVNRLEATIKASVAVLKETSPGNPEGYNTAMIAAALTLLDGALR